MDKEFRERKERLVSLLEEMAGPMSGRRFADRLGVSSTTIQKWLSLEAITFPSQDNLKRIAEVRGWTLSELEAYLYDEPLNPQKEFSALLAEVRLLGWEEKAIVLEAIAESIKGASIPRQSVNNC